MPPSCCRNRDLHGSVSSFAFQGTNANVVLEMPGLAVLGRPQAGAWQRSRLWYQGPTHPLLQQFRGLSRPLIGAEPYALVQCSLHQPAMSHLLDHSLQDVAVLPSSLLLEMAWAAARMLSPHATTSSDSVAVIDASFPQHLVLDFTALAVTTCGVTVGSGLIWLAVQPNQFGEPANSLCTACLQFVAGPGAGAAGLSADYSYHLPKECNGVPSTGTAPLPGAVALVYLAAFLTWGTMQVSPSNTSNIQADMHVGYGLPPAAGIACQQLASVNDSSARNAGTVLPTAVKAYIPLPQQTCGRASAAIATGDSHGSDQQLLESSRQALFVFGSQMKATTRLPVELGSKLNGLARHGDTTATNLQLHGPSLQSTQRSVLTVIIETTSMLLGNIIDADQPFMEAGLDSIGGRAFAVVQKCLGIGAAFLADPVCQRTHKPQ